MRKPERFKDKVGLDEWRVERVNEPEGDIDVAVFTGANAEEWSSRFFALMNAATPDGQRKPRLQYLRRIK